MDSVAVEYDRKRESAAVESEGIKALEDRRFIDAARIFWKLISEGAIKSGNKMGFYQYKLGMAYMLQGFRVDEDTADSRKLLKDAEEQFQKALTNLSQNDRIIRSQIHLSLGDIYFKDGDIDKAAKYYADSLTYLETEVRDYHEGLEVLNFKLCLAFQDSNVEKAIEYCNRASDICWLRQKQNTRKLERATSENQSAHFTNELKKLHNKRSFYLLELDDMKRTLVDTRHGTRWRFDAQLLTSFVSVLMELVILVIEQKNSDKEWYSRKTRVGLKFVVVVASLVIIGIAIKETCEKIRGAMKKGAHWMWNHGIPLLRNMEKKVIWNELAISNVIFALVGLGGALAVLFEYILRNDKLTTPNILPLLFALVMSIGSWQRMTR